MKTLTIVMIILILILMPLFGQSESLKKRFELDPDKTAHLYFRDIDGDVRVMTHDKKEIIFEFVKELKGSASEKNREYFSNIRPEITFENNTLTVEIKYPKRHFQIFTSFSSRIRVRSTLHVPRQISSNIRLVDGNMQVAGLAGHIDLKSVDGDIEARECQGRLKLHSVDGDVDARGIKGTVDTHTTDGDVTVAGIFDQIHFKSVDGNGNFDIKPGSVIKSDCSFKTVDGDIHLSYPESLDFRVNISTTDGSIDVDSKFENISLKKKNKFTASKGDARFLIKINTVDGDVSLKEFKQ